jgi:Uroporphyrinogen decarboxylase (URO-D)
MAPQLDRANEPFVWGVSCGMSVYAHLAGVRHDRLFRDFDGIVEAYTRGRPMAEELLGPDVICSGPCWIGNSYGHVNALGSELIFPEDSEVGHTPIYDSLDQGIAALKKPVVFEEQGLFPEMLKLWERLKERFPEHHGPFMAYKAEGPITTAWLLRGHDFFMDVMLDPERAQEFLQLVTESTIKYRKLVQRINGRPEVDPVITHLPDDVAAMLSPDLWPTMVIPCLETHFSSLTSGERSVHIEDLRPEHLHYLDELRIDRYDPAVSPKLTPALVRDGCKSVFGWRYHAMTCAATPIEDTARWVAEAVAGGASRVFATVAPVMLADDRLPRLRAFIEAAKQAKSLLESGCQREAIVEEMV